MEEISKYSPEAVTPKELRKWNFEKYHMFSMILEYLVDCHQITKSDVPKENIVGMLKQQGVPKYDKKFDAKITTILMQMGWIGLITIKGNRVSIAEDGINAYKEQRYHEIAANLYNAEQTKRLSVLAIWIASILSGLSIILTIINALLQVGKCC